MCEFLDLNISGHNFILSAIDNGLVLDVIKPYNDRKLFRAKNNVVAKSAVCGAVQSAHNNFTLSFIREGTSVLNWSCNLLRYESCRVST